MAVASCVSLIALFYYYNYRKDLGGERARILKDRKALADDIASDYGSLRARIEQWTVDGATQPFAGDYVDPEAKNPAWRERPSIYLRLRAADATKLEAVHAGAKLTSLDGIPACLLRVKGSYGPWAWGEIVARTEMLGADFQTDVRETNNDLKLRNLAYALDMYRQNDFPQARDGIRMAEYAIIAIDEDPSAVPVSLAYGEDASIAQRIHGVAHPIRLFLRRLSDGKELLRVRRTPDMQLVQVQGDNVVPAAGLEITRGKALDCALANDALTAAGFLGSAEMNAAGSPFPLAAVPSSSASAAPSGSASAAPPGSASAAPAGSASSAPSASASTPPPLPSSSGAK
jgi:hypothetical protein